MPPELLISSLTCSLTCTYYSDTTYLMTLPATAADDAIVVVFKNIRNPKSTAPTTSFQVRIMDASAILLQYRTTSISYSATQPAGLSITLNRNSTQNSARNVQYEFELGITFAYSDPVAVLITFVNGIGCSGCLVDSNNATHYSILKDQLTF